MQIPRIRPHEHGGNPFIEGAERALRVLVDPQLRSDTSEDYGADFYRLLSGDVPVHSDMSMLEPFFRRSDLYVYGSAGLWVDEIVEEGDVLNGIYEFVTRSAAGGKFTIRGFAHHNALRDVAERNAKDGHADLDTCLSSLVLQSIAEQLDVDVLLTSRDCIVRHGLRTSRDSSVCTPTQFVALLGLYLRTRRDWTFVGPRGGGMGPWRGSLVASRALVKRSELLVSVAMADDQRRAEKGTSRDLAEAAFGIFRRLARSLAIRDEVHRQYLIPWSNQTGDVASSHFEWLALNLAGTMDLVTRFLALAVNFPIDKKMDLLSGDFRRAVLRSRHVNLHSIYDSSIEHSVRLCRTLRNSVHDATLDDVASEGDSGRLIPYIELSPGASSEVCKLLHKLAEDREVWGVRDSYREKRVMIEVDYFSDRLLCLMVKVLNGLVELLPFESYQGFQSSFYDEKERDGDFSPSMKLRALKLYGLV